MPETDVDLTGSLLTRALLGPQSSRDSTRQIPALVSASQSVTECPFKISNHDNLICEFKVCCVAESCTEHNLTTSTFRLSSPGPLALQMKSGSQSLSLTTRMIKSLSTPSSNGNSFPDDHTATHPLNNVRIASHLGIRTVSLYHILNITRITTSPSQTRPRRNTNPQ